ncbi:Isochorismatase-like protein [Vararia minispora EC-137]|uniref:Isochorismatase-like protein n=1 Tax=Vararia minispora EC-137 TaxID=1314806 RepID=A0ACB8QD44_9AGAM|nr:Isochorismatase-like protein [Vararia minispora EC-137]
MALSVVKAVPGRTVFFLCDMQERFRSAIHAFDKLVLTGQKVIKAAKILEVPLVVTEQNPRALGATITELSPTTHNLGALHLGTIEKTLFSMATPEVFAILERRQMTSIVLFGIESHVCVLQSTLDLLERGYQVHVLADGVSSCNKEEVPFALARMRQAGAQITTSESLLFQLMRDSSSPNFKALSAIIKEEKENTTNALQALLPVKPAL